MFVYGNKFSSVLAVFLCVAFLVQPLNQAVANVDVNEEAEVVVADEVVFDVAETTETEPEPELDNVVMTTTTEAADIDEVAEEAPAEQPEVSEQAATTSTDSEADATAETATSSTQSTSAATTTIADNATSTSLTGTSTIHSASSTATTTESTTATTTTTTKSTNSSSNGGSATTEESEDVATTTATTTALSDSATSSDDGEDSTSDRDERQDTADNDTERIADTNADAESATASSTIETLPVTTNENYYQFSRQACVAVGDGTYHCSAAPEDAVETSEVVFAEIGDSGTMEIFLRTKRGEIEQLTNNTYDDSSPFYDPGSQSIVWQRLVDDRYQIISYDITSRSEQQLTFSRTNNMQPKVSDAGVVWQAWDGNDWEIMYFDGAFTEQITDNRAQDVTPVIEDDYVVWSVLGSQEQEAQVYSIKNGEIMTISDHEGGSIINPRFVLIYDTKFENGDIITQGFDPVTGLSEQIAAQTAPEPINIPAPDPIGEIRALLSNKSVNDEELEDDKEPIPGGTNNDPKKATTSDTLVVTATSTTDDPQESATSSVTFELGDYDLVITPTTTVTEAKPENDEELVEDIATSTQQ